MLTGCAAVRINVANERMPGEGQTWMSVSLPVMFSTGVSPPIHRAFLHPRMVLVGAELMGAFVIYMGGERRVGGKASDESHYSRHRNGSSSCH